MVKGFLFFSLLAAFSFADESIILYKNGGKKLFDTQLDKPIYWLYKLSNKDLRFGYYERLGSLLKVEKEKGSLELYVPNNNNNDQFLLKRRYSALTGKNPGDKKIEGDLKTPIGVYRFVQKKKTVDPFYGPMAFVTSYPNLYDRIRGKSGDGIWLHGVPLSGSRDPFTRGCVAINNSDLMQLDQTINPYETLVIIDTTFKPLNSPTAYSTILSELYRWRAAWINNDLTTYLSFYDPEFKKTDGTRFNQFKSMKERIFAKQESKTIDFEEMNITPYPGEKNLFWISYKQTYNSESYRHSGNKSLLVKLTTNQSISILIEE